MAHLDDMQIRAELEIAQKAVIDAAKAWRSAPNVEAWRPACQTLMEAVDTLRNVQREYQRRLTEPVPGSLTHTPGGVTPVRIRPE